MESYPIYFDVSVSDESCYEREREKEKKKERQRERKRKRERERERERERASERERERLFVDNICKTRKKYSLCIL